MGEPFFDELLHERLEILPALRGIHFEFFEEGVMDFLERLAVLNELPDAGADGIQAKVLAGSLVQDDQLAGDFGKDSVFGKLQDAVVLKRTWHNAAQDTMGGGGVSNDIEGWLDGS